MATAQLNLAAFKSSIKSRLAATPDKTRAIADLALQQVMDRYATGGQSGNDPWPPTLSAELGKKPPLDGLQDTWEARGEHGVAIVASSSWLCLVHHLGTEGKGGSLPTIVPRYALKLYVPISRKGVLHYENYKSRAPVIQHVYAGISTIQGPKFKTGYDDAKYGVDYLLLDHVDLDPRRQLPVSEGERADLAPKSMKILAGQTP